MLDTMEDAGDTSRKTQTGSYPHRVYFLMESNFPILGLFVSHQLALSCLS